MLKFNCYKCGQPLLIPEQYAGNSVACPSCRHVQVAPVAQDAVAVEQALVVLEPTAATDVRSASSKPSSSPPPPLNVPANRPIGGTGFGSRSAARYGFPCPYCSSRLEATGASAGTEGECPTCGNSILIPILDASGRLIDPITREIIKQDPHPVHAYAAAGHRAPRIVRGDAGQQIVCTRCHSSSVITANNCKKCGMPFTMEGTAPDALSTTSNYAVASVVLGIIGIPTFCTIIIPGLAVIFGIAAVMETRGSETKGGYWLGIVGIGLGAVGVLIGVFAFLN